MVSAAIACARAEPVGQHRVDIDRILRQPLHLRADRPELGDREIDQRAFEGRELPAAEFAQHLRLARALERGVDADQVVGLRPRLETLLLARQRLGIGLGLADLLRDGVGVVGQVDARIIGRLRLRHFLGAVAQAHHPRRRPLDDRLRLREERIAVAVRVDRGAEIVVEFLRDVARQLEMLLLVLADRNVGRAVDQDVGRHQVRIDVQTDRGVLAVLAGLLLELRHAVEPAHARDAVEHPGELGVLGHLALVEDDVLVRVDAAGDEGGGHLARRLRQLGRILPDRDGVQVDHAIDAVVALLQRHEFHDGAEIIAEVQVAGRLHAGKHALLERHRLTPATVAGHIA